MKQLIVATLCAAFLFTSACTKNRISGSGSIQTETRSLPHFNKVRMNGGTDIHISQGSSFEVKVKAYGNLLPYLATEVQGETLVIEYKEKYNVRNDNSEVFLTMPELSGIAISGDGNVNVGGAFASEHLDISVSGSSDMSLQGGQADYYTVHISGSGNISGFDFPVKHANITLSGSGTVKTTVSETLKASISGSGIVYYKGSPAVESNISGSGKVVHQ